MVGLSGLAIHWSSPARSLPTGSDIGSLTPTSTPSNLLPRASGLETPATPGGGLLDTHSTELGAQGDDGARPTDVAIPRLRLHAVATPAGVATDQHSLDLPPSARAVVWWAYGAAPGAPTGTVLLAGHVSWAGRLGALAGLGRLRLGDVVTLGRRDGTSVRYEVTGRRRVPKASLDELGVFATGGPPRLALVTCGGQYDAARHSYEDNVVVVARPI